MRRALLAIDVGGSTSRANILDEAGNCLGHGQDRGGNPASNTPDQAADAIISSVRAAVTASGAPLDIAIALIALAGPRNRGAGDRLAAAFRGLGLSGPLVFSSDLLAMFNSIAAAPTDIVLWPGRVRRHAHSRGEVDRVVDAAGWLLGDNGSGYSLGHRAARAVVADLEERGEQTALTPALLEAMGVAYSDDLQNGRTGTLQTFINAIYMLRPIELARFAPIVIAHREDAVAARFIAEAERWLTSYFEIVFDPQMPGPVALGGGVIAHLTGLPAAIAERISASGHEPVVRLAGDGAIGAAVLAMRALGMAVDDAMVETIATSIKANRTKTAPA